MESSPQPLYQVQGKERAQLLSVMRRLAAQQSAFEALVRFIAEREAIDLRSATFDSDDVAFVVIPAQAS